MSFSWYHQEKLAFERHAELLEAARAARQAKELRGATVHSPVLPRLFSWLGRLSEAFRQPWAGWVNRNKIRSAQKMSYLENPDPFKDCVTC